MPIEVFYLAVVFVVAIVGFCILKSPSLRILRLPL